MRWRVRILVSILFCALFSLASYSASHVFQPDAFLRHVQFLASDELEGRGNGTPGLEKAAEYIAKVYKEGGLLPAGDDGTFFQRFMLTTGSQLGPNNKLTLKMGDQTLEAALNKDFVPFAVGEKTSVTGEIVFAGYGITADEYRYDDYKEIDVTDKIVLVLAHEPRENDAQSPFNGKEPTLYGEDNPKVYNARYRSARAILIVLDPVNHANSEKDLPDAEAVTQIDELGICALRISRNLADKILGAQNLKLVDLQNGIDEKLAPQTKPLAGVQATIEMDVTKIRKEVRNVVGLLPATESALAGESVILGAHYDHLGRGGRSSITPQLIGKIHHGADDNASGTAGLMELAVALAKDPTPRKRDYLFIAFAGEELGLQGSSYWASHPTRPIEKAVTMINMDMIGRPQNNQIVVSGVGTSPLFPDLLKNAAAESGLELKTTQSGVGGSDHTSFYVKNMPVLFFFSGLHGDYHRPSDEWQKINSVGASKILSMVYSVATQLNLQEARPQFTKVSEPMVTGASRGAGGGGLGVYFGSVPDFTADVKGYRFSDVRPGSPAAKAGLRAQDVMIKFDGKEVNSLEDYSYLLRMHKPGDSVEVVVLRDGQPLTVQVKLEVRR
jgi:hypothetical protein